MVRVAICDDEKFERDRIRHLFTEYAVKNNMEFTIDEYVTGDELLTNYEKDTYTFVFLDVEMGGKDGIMTADAIRRIPDHNVIIVFVTNYPQYMQQSFDVRAAQFFSKPLKYEVFEKKINAMFEWLKDEPDEMILFEDKKAKYCLRRSDIYEIRTTMIFGRSRELEIQTAKETIFIHGKLSEYMEKLEEFMVTPNRSVLVNMDHVEKLVGNELILDNGKKIEVTKSRMKDVTDKFVEKVRKELRL